jgi:hypothetical protein
MRFFFILLASFIFIYSGNAQKDTTGFPVIFSLFNNSTLLPGKGVMGIINTPVHPGLRVGSSVTFNESRKSVLLETFNLAFYYHKLSQTGIQLYSELWYRHKLINRLEIGGQVLLGYMLAKPDLQVFELKNDGNYTDKSILRSQIIAGAGLGLSYKIFQNTEHPLQIFMNYQFYLQMPFVKNYVPMLPNTSLHMGTIFYLTKKKK